MTAQLPEEREREGGREGERERDYQKKKEMREREREREREDITGYPHRVDGRTHFDDRMLLEEVCVCVCVCVFTCRCVMCESKDK